MSHNKTSVSCSYRITDKKVIASIFNIALRVYFYKDSQRHITSVSITFKEIETRNET